MEVKWMTERLSLFLMLEPLLKWEATSVAGIVMYALITLSLVLKGEVKCVDRLAREPQRTIVAHLRLQQRRQLCLPQNTGGDRLQSPNLANSFWFRQAASSHTSPKEKGLCHGRRATTVMMRPPCFCGRNRTQPWILVPEGVAEMTKKKIKQDS